MTPSPEPFRPLIHYSPARNGMNDPNGPVSFGGVYHLFYRYTPHGDLPGHLRWGHAISTDLLHWRKQQVACDTGHRQGNESQFLAFSSDGGWTWVYESDTPVLDFGQSDFRDPRIFWPEGSGRWIMADVHPNERQVGFYGSPDLHAWTILSLFGPAGEVGGVWEMPELVPLQDEDGRTWWLLKVDLNPGGPCDGSGAQSWLGDFGGATFTALTFSGVQPRIIWMARMNNWQYAQQLPTAPGRGRVPAARS